MKFSGKDWPCIPMIDRWALVEVCTVWVLSNFCLRLLVRNLWRVTSFKNHRNRWKPLICRQTALQWLCVAAHHPLSDSLSMGARRHGQEGALVPPPSPAPWKCGSVFVH